MELWLRSQDKEVLIAANALYVSINYGGSLKKENIVYDIKNGNPEQINYTLGRYKTKKRALEVLDEIQNFINKNGKVIIDENYFGQLTKELNVYEMPQV